MILRSKAMRNKRWIGFQSSWWRGEKVERWKHFSTTLVARTLGGEKSFVSAVQIWCGVSNTASSTAFNNWLDKKTNTKADKNTKTDKNIMTDKKTKTDKIQLWVEVDW